MTNISTTNGNRLLLIVLATALIVITKTSAARDINVRDMVTARGECHIELVKGAGYGRCKDGVIYMLFKNGRHVIVFSNPDDTVIALAGSGDRQPRLEHYYI